MKKLFIVIMLLSATITFGQKKTAESRAKANTKEMVKVLSLTKDEELKIYEIHLEKNKQLIDNENSNRTSEDKKAAKKEIYAVSSKQFKETLGTEKLKEWRAYTSKKAKK